MNLRHNMSVTQSVRRWLLAVPLTLSFWLASAQTYSFGQTLALTTDKACYQPGSTVTFTASGTIPASDTATILTEMAYLNRLHINGVQFYDWQWKHHEPVKFTGDGSLDPWYQDISYRWTGVARIKKYIEVQHQYGMKSMFYNLCSEYCGRFERRWGRILHAFGREGLEASPWHLLETAERKEHEGVISLFRLS